ncbi:uncharacterized protein V6R79_012709 [Siganus canaliculatus]
MNCLARDEWLVEAHIAPQRTGIIHNYGPSAWVLIGFFVFFFVPTSSRFLEIEADKFNIYDYRLRFDRDSTSDHSRIIQII